MTGVSPPQLALGCTASKVRPLWSEPCIRSTKEAGLPLINVQMLTGRTPEQKRALMRGLAQATMDSLGVPEAAIRVILTEVAPEHWGVGLKSKADG